MSNHIRERYAPVLVGAGATVPITSNAVGCFLCTTTGTITINVNPADGKAGYALVTDLAVTAGGFYKLPFYLGSNGGNIVSTAAIGVLGV